MIRVFICSPYRGDIEANIAKAREYCRLAIQHGYLPIAPHLYFTQFLDEDIEEERNKGIDMGLNLMHSCHEVWVFGEPTEGMMRELTHAVHYNIPIKSVPPSV